MGEEYGFQRATHIVQNKHYLYLYCQNCGNQLQPGEVCCNKCGMPVPEMGTNFGSGEQNMNREIISQIMEQENEGVTKSKSFLKRVSDKTNKTALVAAIVMFMAMFMTFAKVSLFTYTQSVSYISTEDGKIVIVLLVLAVVS